MCIQVFVTIEPSLGVLAPLTEKVTVQLYTYVQCKYTRISKSTFVQFESAEDSHLLSKATTWLKTLREKHPSRNYQVKTFSNLNYTTSIIDHMYRPQYWM